MTNDPRVVESKGQNGLPKFTVKEGSVWGRLTVIGRAPNSRHYYCSRVFVRCECGVEKAVVERALRRNRVKSCGCARKAQAAKVGAKQARGPRKQGRFALPPNEQEPNFRDAEGKLNILKCFVCVPTGRANHAHMVKIACGWCGWRAQ